MAGQPPIPKPRSLKGDAHGLTINWADGVSHTIPWRVLRQVCPCATCRTERERPAVAEDDLELPILTPAQAQPLRATAMRPVGNYAYAVNFTDGHNTGIYSLELLRQVGEEIAKAGLNP